MIRFSCQVLSVITLEKAYLGSITLDIVWMIKSASRLTLLQTACLAFYTECNQIKSRARVPVCILSGCTLDEIRIKYRQNPCSLNH